MDKWKKNVVYGKPKEGSWADFVNDTTLFDLFYDHVETPKWLLESMTSQYRYRVSIDTGCQISSTTRYQSVLIYACAVLHRTPSTVEIPIELHVVLFQRHIILLNMEFLNNLHYFQNFIHFFLRKIILNAWEIIKSFFTF